MAKKIAKAPVEWVDGKIVLGAPPAIPLKGKGNRRLTIEEVGWEITESLFKWFYRHLEDRHKTAGKKFHDPDDLGEMLRENSSFNNNYQAISLEANKLLKDKLGFWEEKAKEELKSKRDKKKQEMEGGDFETPPEWVGEKIVLPKPAESPNKKYYWKPNFDGENYKAVLWFRDHLPNAHQGQVIDPNNGFPAKTMSTEAGELWFKHKGFWLSQYFIPIKEKEAQKKELVSVGRETLKNASAKAGVSLKELNQKLERLSTLAKGEDLDLAIRMVTDFDDVWLFESLLAGSTIDKEGYLVPGKPLKIFKDHAEFFGILALVNAPEGTNLHPSLNKTKLQYFKINDPVLEMLGRYEKHITKKCPALQSTGRLDFYRLISLSNTEAESLSKHNGDLYLDSLQILNNSHGHIALAEKLAHQKGDLNLSELKSLGDAAAEALSKHKGDLDLSGLESLSDTAAQALSKHQGFLNLGGLKSLSDSTGHVALAKKLAREQGELWLRNLASLSDAAALALSKHKGDLNLSLKSLDDSPGHFALATKIASKKGYLWLDGLESLSDAAAEALSKHTGELNLEGLESLSDAAAEALSKHKGDLHLGGCTNLSDAAAVALSKHKGELNLYGLKSLSDTAVGALSKHKGNLHLGCRNLSDAAAFALSKHKGDLKLRGLKTLNDTPEHIALAAKLAIQKGYLGLNSLESLGDAAAMALSKHKGDLSLNSLESLGDGAAMALSKHKGDLSIENLKSLNDSPGHIAFAEKLASQKEQGYDGHLDLKGLKSLSDAAARALAKKKGGMRKLRVSDTIKKQIQKYRK